MREKKKTSSINLIARSTLSNDAIRLTRADSASRRKDWSSDSSERIVAPFGYRSSKIRRALDGSRETNERTNEAWQSRLRRGRGSVRPLNPLDSHPSLPPPLDRSGRSHVSGPS